MGDETVTLNRRNTSVHSAESEHAEGLPDNTVNGGETNQHVEENLQVKNIVSGETERDRRDSSHVAGYRDQQHQDQLLPKNPSDDTASQSFFGVIAGKSRALRDNFSIVVPPVKRSLNYQLLDAEPTVRRVLNEFPDFSGVKFLVEYNKGGHAIVASGQFHRYRGGPLALARYSQHSERQRTDSETQASDTMVSARQLASKRGPPLGFVDSSALELSEEDELDMPSSGGGEGHRSNKRKNSPTDTGDLHRHRNGRRSVRAAKNEVKNYDDFERSTEQSESGGNSSDDSLINPTKKRIFFTKTKTGPVPERRSSRTGRISKTMLEYGEDDIPEVVWDAKQPLKAVAAKEVFKELPASDDFRQRHCQSCPVCSETGDSDERGSLVFCQGCAYSYHKGCLGPRNGRKHLVTKIGDEDFVLQCRYCMGSAKLKDHFAPNQGQCSTCHEQGVACNPFRQQKSSKQEEKEREENDGKDPITSVDSQLVNKVENVLFRCFTCHRAFHFHHLPSKSDAVVLGVVDQEQESMSRFQEYCRDWLCVECAEKPSEIEALIAWRPLDLEAYVPGCTTEQVGEDDKEYLIKWKSISYFGVTWMPGAWVWGRTAAAMRKAFVRRHEANLPKMQIEDAVPEDFLRVDIVFDVDYTNVANTNLEEVDKARVKEVSQALVKYKGLGYEAVVWEAPPDLEDTERWEDFKRAYETWVQGRYLRLQVSHHLQSHLKAVRKQDFQSKIMMANQPETLTGGKLMGYQMDGLNWLLFQWHQCHNAILADEMGLGKTIQVIGFIATLQKEHKCSPFLIVVPNSTCANWRREIQQWAPSLRVVCYFGSAEARELAMKYELFPENAKDMRSHIVVTSYDTAQDENCQRFFRKIAWQGLVVDEGQRLKNDKNLLYAALSRIKAPFKVLLTGTPLQNNPRELFNLLQFLDSDVDAAALETEYADLSKENVSKLHDMLRPFFLRRTKLQVLDFLPPVAQIIVPVTMSPLQTRLYKSILEKDPQLMRAILGGDTNSKKLGSLRNLLMQLRKCLCHPYVYSRAIEERTSNEGLSHRSLVEASSKFQLLNIMLPKLKERGHRVLIFSQFLGMLDMVEDFLNGLGLLHERLDGSMGSLQKQKRIDEFNAPDSPLFAFLLSTRAGGVGINLATADTVIILDPDFNPHQDIQALSRAHRIGQKKKVLVFQLMTRGSAEEKMMQIGRKKMALDHVLIEQMDAEDLEGHDLESVLRFGADALYSENDKQTDIQYDSQSVDLLLDRSQIENTHSGTDKTAESQFSFARVWANDKNMLEDGLTISSENEQVDPSTWEKILANRAREAARQAALEKEALGRGKRKRQTIDYTTSIINGADRDSPVKRRRENGSDEDTNYESNAAESEAEESVIADDEQVSTRELDEGPQHRESRGAILSDGAPTSKSGDFHRALISKPTTPKSVSKSPSQHPCLLCGNQYGPHAKGSCPIKKAKAEYCNLCNTAHYGRGRTCPKIQSIEETRRMMQVIKQSPENQALKQAASRYLAGVIGDLNQRERKKTERVGQVNDGQMNPTQPRVTNDQNNNPNAQQAPARHVHPNTFGSDQHVNGHGNGVRESNGNGSIDLT